MIRMMSPTSKASLKHQCLLISNGNVDEAKKLYDFYMDGMEDLPMFDAQPPTWMDNVKNGANGFIGWIKENQDTLVQGFDFVRGIIANKGLTPPPETAGATPLPPING